MIRDFNETYIWESLILLFSFHLTQSPTNTKPSHTNQLKTTINHQSNLQIQYLNHREPPMSAQAMYTNISITNKTHQSLLKAHQSHHNFLLVMAVPSIPAQKNQPASFLIIHSTWPKLERDKMRKERKKRERRDKWATMREKESGNVWRRRERGKRKEKKEKK